MQPAYTWLWNSTITKEGIKKQIDEMYDSGIRAFYVLGEPEYFRPKTRKTHLFPEYLSKEYLELLYYAFSYSKSKGMYTWLYNEGGFPSGMVCGKIRKEHPELAKKQIIKEKQVYSKNQKIEFEDNLIVAFAGGEPVKKDKIFDCETEVIKYYFCDDATGINADIASPDTAFHFINMTHEKLKECFRESMGNEIKLMFDDEASMGKWSLDFSNTFKNYYGYEIEPYIPYIMSDKEPSRDEEYKAVSDYYMLCKELVCKNYFSPMRKWLNDNNMLSAGHIDNDHTANGAVINNYGNSLKILREFDIPGVDVIWNQIIYPSGNKVCETGMDFFPVFASSAARQQGHSRCLSESMAVYGAHSDPELMRYVVNYQAVRGISLFNFMVISYDRSSARVHQYRPNFVKENPCMDHLKEINEYTARVSYILQNSTADIKTALYYPARSICACGKKGDNARVSFEKMGEMLEKSGVCFDIIDEDIVKESKIENRTLKYNDLIYENVFVPQGDFEEDIVKEKLSLLKSDVVPCIKRKNEFLLTRKLILDNSEGYFICNTGNKEIKEHIEIKNNKTPYIINLSTGDTESISYIKNEETTEFDISLSRGEAIFIYFTNDKINAVCNQREYICKLEEFKSYVSREYKIDVNKNIINTYYASNEIKNGFYEWEKDFSGEITYLCKLPVLEAGEYEIDLGDVKSVADVYIDNSFIDTAVYPPYKVRIKICDKKESELKIVVTNTAANQCTATEYFNNQEKADVGPYHERMVIAEKYYGAGGFKGPVILNKIK